MNERDRRLTTADLAGAGRQEQTRERIRGAPHGERRPEAEYMETRSPGAGMARETEAPMLFSPEESEGMRDRWSDIQAGFVDEPRRAVEQADELVAECIRRLAESFAEERDRLERQWDSGDNVSTEDLRVVLQRYRSFFTRLLSM
jgi:hypothetical protein